jgi:hypothetical protein
LTGTHYWEIWRILTWLSSLLLKNKTYSEKYSDCNLLNPEESATEQYAQKSSLIFTKKVAF